MKAQTTLRLVTGGRHTGDRVECPARGRVLHPTSALARRAGITPVAVPDGMWVAPSLLVEPVATLRVPRAERHLRAVA